MKSTLGNTIHIQKNLTDKLRQADKSQMHIPHNFCHWSMFRLLIRDVKSVGNMADRLCRVSWSRVTCNNIMEKKICSNCSTSISRGHTTRKSTIMDQGLIQRGVKNYMHIISPRTWPSQLLSVFFLLLNQNHAENGHVLV